MNNKSTNINPRWQPTPHAPLPTARHLQGIAEGSVAALSAAITLIESTHQAHQAQANQLLKQLPPPPRPTLRIGITGIPGAGKSTFIQAIGLHAINQNKKVAVLAIDPSSTQSGGSILGDKTRMQRLSNHPNAFIRPSATAGNLGGVAQRTHQTMLLCEAAGYDIIIIETVGVGQSEVEVAQLTDFFLLLTIAGAGDELQGIKRGIIELADAIIINKTDAVPQNIIKNTQAMYQNALHFFNQKPSKFNVNTFTCSALHSKGIDEIWQLILQYHAHTTQNGYHAQKRNNQTNYWLHQHLKAAILNDFYTNKNIQLSLQNTQKNIDNNPNILFETIDDLLKKWRGNEFI